MWVDTGGASHMLDARFAGKEAGEGHLLIRIKILA